MGWPLAGFPSSPEAQGGWSWERPFPEVEKVLCDLRWPLSLSEPLFPGLLSEHLDLGVALPEARVSAHSLIPPSAGPATWLCVSVPWQCLVHSQDSAKAC